MKHLILLIFYVFSLSIASAAVPERIKSALINYVKQGGGAKAATILIGKDNVGEDGVWVYWIEKKLLINIPKDFRDEAIEKPSLIVRRPLEYPTDVRAKGGKELETSTYLVDFEWYHETLLEILTVGQVLHITHQPS